MNSLKFLEKLYGTKPDESYILLWKNKKSFWFQETKKAAEYIENNKEDIYYGVGLSSENYGNIKRCIASKIAGIPGLYVDIDIGDSKKKHYPKTLKEAIDLVEDKFLKPSLIISSGHGLHAYWLFKEVWMFESNQEREFAANLNKRLNYFIKSKAEKQGYTIDSVFDLARILRPVGSLNCKKELKKEVVLIKDSNCLYTDPEQFDKILPIPDIYGITPIERVSKEELHELQKMITLKNVAEPPQDKLDNLIEMDAEFKAAWIKMNDKSKDNSISGYHFRMAKISIMAGWEDQEIANLLVAWNRRHGEDLTKLIKRPDYIIRTIENARSGASKELAEEYTEELKDIAGSKYEDSLKESFKKKSLEILSYHLGFKVLNLIKYPMEKKHKYKMETLKGDIYFQEQSELTTKAKFIERIFSEINKAITITPKNFEIIKNTYEPIMRVVEISAENSIQGRMKSWLSEYLENAAILDQHEGVVDLRPFVFDEHWYIYPTSFKSWAYRNKHDREDMKSMSFDLSTVGCIEKRFNPRKPNTKMNERIKKMAWMVPADIAAPKKKENVDRITKC